MKITIVGTGNVAWHIGNHLAKKGVHIVQMYNRTIAKAHELQHRIGYPIPCTDILDELTIPTDIYLLMTRDDVLPEIVAQLSLKNAIIAHTSGSSAMEVLGNGYNANIGVWYPFQTFSKGKEVILDTIPFCIEGNNENVRTTLFALASLVSSNVHYIDSQQRKILHLTAIYTNNFANHLFTIAEELVTIHNLPFDFLRPLIQETAHKIQELSPSLSQTGPAKRNDLRILQQHENLLAEYPEYLAIYQLLTTSIQKKYLTND